VSLDFLEILGRRKKIKYHKVGSGQIWPPHLWQRLSPKQISSTYINSWLRYNYFCFGKTNVRHIGILLPVTSRRLGRNLHIILHQHTELRPNRSTQSGSMTLYPLLKMAAATAKHYFRFRICWCHCFQNVKSYQQTKFRRHISIGGWDINYFRFWQANVRHIGILLPVSILTPLPVICMLFCIRRPNDVQIWAHTAEIWRHIHFSTWRPRRLNATSGFVFVDVAVFRRPKSIRKPNFVDIAQLTAEM